MMANNKSCVWYAPLPEERNPDESASRAFADRIGEQVVQNHMTCVLEILDLETIKSAMAAAAETALGGSTVHFFIISCDADGSVHKAVRKISRELMKKKGNDATEPMEDNIQQHVAVALLGHARCENSAQQMGDTIFTTGRKFEKAITGAIGTKLLVDRLEVQAELEGPEVGFDPWVQSAFNELVKKTAL